jgi:CO/xanthine dehydrogenase Mo-binding subunit
MTDLGREAIRVSDLNRSTGQMRFPSDIYRPGNLAGVVVRSPITHGRLMRLDVDAALRMPGVRAIVTADDIPGVKFVGKMIQDTPVLVQVGKKVNSVLDAICLVAAETEDQARTAVEQIVMEIEPLPAISTPEEALIPDAPQVHEGGNLAKLFKLRHGDVSKGFAESDVIVEAEYEIPAIEHAFMETEAAFGEPMSDGVRIFVGSQNPYLERELTQAVLDLPETQVEVIDVGAGGGFGGKDDSLITLYVALLTWRCRKPVRMVWNRRESIRGHSKRHPMKIKAKTGARRNGYLTAMQLQITADTGSYAHWGPAILTFASLGAGGVYEIPHLWVDTKVVYTHNIMSGAMRAWGNQAIAFVVESQVDQLAAEVGIHPLRFRWLNALQEGSPMASGRSAPPGVGVRRTIEAAAKQLGIDLHDPELSPNSSVGFATVMQGVNYHFGYEDAAEAEIRLAEDDVFEVYAATSDIGQGLEAEIRLLLSRALGDLPIEKTRWMPQSTATSPNAGSTGASRHTGVTANAIWGAGLQIKRQILALAAEMMGSTPDQIEMQGSQLWDATHELHLTEVISEAHNRGVPIEAHYRFVAPPTTAIDEDGQGYPVNQYSYGTQIAHVDVDRLTGVVKVKRVDAFIDAGQILNPLGAKKQSEGGIIMGLGYGLTEAFIRADGKPLTDSLATFLIPTISDAPLEINTTFVGEPIPLGYLGARGLAELVMVPTAPAILNAIYAASGARLFRIPATPEHVHNALALRAGFEDAKSPEDTLQ